MIDNLEELTLSPFPPSEPSFPWIPGNPVMPDLPAFPAYPKSPFGPYKTKCYWKLKLLLDITTCFFYTG